MCAFARCAESRFRAAPSTDAFRRPPNRRPLSRHRFKRLHVRDARTGVRPVGTEPAPDSFRLLQQRGSRTQTAFSPAFTLRLGRVRGCATKKDSMYTAPTSGSTPSRARLGFGSGRIAFGGFVSGRWPPAKSMGFRVGRAMAVVPGRDRGTAPRSIFLRIADDADAPGASLVCEFVPVSTVADCGIALPVLVCTKTTCQIRTFETVMSRIFGVKSWEGNLVSRVRPAPYPDNLEGFAWRRTGGRKDASMILDRKSRRHSR